ncbi:glycoside hydrolase family 13 protein [candidate division KSB1 bacterium]|nr:glycoside hydrolase family 13 protein [candidate division KSB1 bacterium]
MPASQVSNIPEWAKHALWYQIFPERFRNGDPTNDPTIESVEGAYPHDVTSPWQIHPWTSDWYELQPYEKLNGKDIWFNLQRRRYGGDLQGIIDKLDYLQELGINALYLNPVFTSPSSHKYDGATYHHIDPHFGPDPAGDKLMIQQEIPDDPTTWVWTSADKLMLTLIAEVHRRGMHIIFDGVFNHVGIMHWAFRDVVEKGRESKFRKWFVIYSYPNAEKNRDLDYRSWWGVHELPEWREDKNGTVAGPRQYIFDITRRWMDPNGDGNPAYGIDGWRLDVAAEVKHEFWKDWRTHVKTINPDAYLVAEIIDPIPVLQPYLQGDEFDAVMNYNFTFAVDEFFIRTKGRATVKEFDARLRELREAFPADVTYVMQNLLDSHDSDRIGSHIVNRNLGSYRKWANHHNLSKAKNPDYITQKPDAHVLQIHKLAAIFQMTYVGAPMIYYGDEAGMWGANDPCCRKPMVWDDLTYDNEVFLPDQTIREQPDSVSVNHDLLAFYKKLIHIRNSYPALQTGDFQTLLTDDENDCYVFSRTLQQQVVIIIINNAETIRDIALSVIKGQSYDVLNNIEYSATETLEINVKPKWAAILIRKIDI